MMMLMQHSLRQWTPRVVPLAVRSLGGLSKKSPGSDPLDILMKECLARNLCDVQGGRMPGVHWVFSIAIAHDDPNKPPVLKTVGIQRVSPAGIDFVMKKKHPANERLLQGKPISFLHTQGKYLPGESAEQWRGEGHCEALPVAEVLDLIPHFTITSMVGSRRIALEYDTIEKTEGNVSEDRLAMLNKSHFTEIVQKTRIELENGDISLEEIDDSIRGFRLQPDRLECMIGGPDSIMWDRWEWLRDNSGDCPEGSIAWTDPKHLIPH